MNLPDVDVVAVDTETTGLHPDDGARVAVISAAWDGGSAAWPFDQGVRDKLPAEQLALGDDADDPNLGEDEWNKVLEWLAGRRLVFHNAKFDLNLLRAGTRHWPGRDLERQLEWDTMLGAWILEPTRSQSLDAAAQRAGLGGKRGLEELQDWLKKRKFDRHRYDLAPWPVAEPYAVADAEQTFALWRHQLPLMRSGELDRMDRELQRLIVLYRMEGRGLGYDAEASLNAAVTIEARADRLERDLPFRATPAGAREYFIQEKGAPVLKYTENGTPSADEETVRAWAAEGIEHAREYALLTRARRAVSMWYRGYPERIGVDGRLRCSYKQTRVKSGRMSVERIQLQAIPKADKYLDMKTGERLPIYRDVPEIRSLVRTRPGHGIWNLDLSQAELRVATKYSRCQRMAEILAEGRDAHGETCQVVLGVEPDSPDWKAKRDIAKRLNFGGIFQIGGAKFQSTLSQLADIHLPLDECEAYVRGWRAMYPEFGVAYRKADEMAATKKWVPILPGTVFERRSHFGERDYPNTGWNRIVQGSLAEFFNLWMTEVERETGALILTVHDSVVLELPEADGDRVAEEVAERGAAWATELFKTEMAVDVDRWC